MLTLLLLLGSLISGRATRLTDPPPDSLGARASSAPSSKWSFAVPQFVAGLGGAALGGAGGAVAGGMFGVFVWMGNGSKYESECNTVCSPDAGSEVRTGARFGALVGSSVYVTRMVSWASPREYPSKNPLVTFAGTLVGGGTAWLATRSMVEPDGAWTWPRWGILAATSSLGAVAADRWFTDPLPVSVDLAMWTPTPGAQGLLLRMGI